MRHRPVKRSFLDERCQRFAGFFGEFLAVAQARNRAHRIKDAGGGHHGADGPFPGRPGRGRFHGGRLLYVAGNKRAPRHGRFGGLSLLRIPSEQHRAPPVPGQTLRRCQTDA